MKVLLILDRKIKLNSTTILHRTELSDFADRAYRISPSNLKAAVKLLMKKYENLGEVITSGICNTERKFRRQYAPVITMLEKQLNRVQPVTKEEIEDKSAKKKKPKNTKHPLLNKAANAWRRVKNSTYCRRKLVVFKSQYGFCFKYKDTAFFALEEATAESVAGAEDFLAQKFKKEKPQAVRAYERLVNRLIHDHIPLRSDVKSEIIRKTVQNLAVIAFISAATVLLYNGVYKSVENTAIQSEIQSIYYDGETSRQAKKADHTKSFKKLLKINDEIIAWVSIDHTKIDYPVLYHKTDTLKDQFYLYRDYNREASDYGSLFLDFRCLDGTDSKNIIVHGHHMNDGSMFANLLKYGKTSIDLGFYKKAPTVTFSTPQNGRQVYKIISVFKTPGDIKDKQFFNYLQGDFSSDAEFMNYVYNVRARSMVKCPVSVNEDDQLLTLSTCSYEPYDGYRTVLVARKTRPGESEKVEIANAKKNTKAYYADDFCYRYGFAQQTLTSFKTELKKGNIDWYDGIGKLNGSQKLKGGKYAIEQRKKMKEEQKKKEAEKKKKEEEKRKKEEEKKKQSSTTEPSTKNKKDKEKTKTEPTKQKETKPKKDKSKIYTVKFLNADGKVIKTQKVKDGKSATAPKPPAKSADEKYTYKFVRWNVKFKKVHSDLKVRPVYKAVKKVKPTKTEKPTTQPTNTEKPTTEPITTATEPETETTEPLVTEPETETE